MVLNPTISMMNLERGKGGGFKNLIGGYVFVCVFWWKLTKMDRWISFRKIGGEAHKYVPCSTLYNSEEAK